MTGFPPRDDEKAISGSEFMARVKATIGDVTTITAGQLEERRAKVEQMILDEVTSGNVPDFMRPENWKTIGIEITQGERRIAAWVRVCPDYLSIGSNGDFARVQLNPLTAQKIADAFELSMPTARLVDIIDAEARHTKATDSDGDERTGMLPFVGAPEIATRVIDPSTKRPVSEKWNHQVYGDYEDRWMKSGEFMEMQDQITDENATEAGSPSFISGIKKDIVYDRLALEDANDGGRPVVIYRPNPSGSGKPIQPLSNAHGELYSDYSHGVRFLDQEVRIRVTEADGTVHEEEMTMQEVLLHDDYHELYSQATMDIGEMYRTRRTAGLTPRRTDQDEVPASVEIPRTEGRARQIY